MCGIPLRLLIVLVSGVLLWFGKSALDTGSVRVKGGYQINKDDSPVNYWLNVGAYLIVGVSGIVYALLIGFIK